jgi:monoamine oxidase
MPEHWEAAVLGAGIAGLCAARALAEAGRSVIVLEANDRVGGRILTESSADSSMAVELGAEFVHGKPEPTLLLAREAGVALTPLPDLHFLKHGNAFLSLPDPWQPFERVMKRLDPSRPDVTAAAFLEQHSVDPETAERFRQLVEGFEAAPIAEVSIKSLSTDSDALAEDDSQFRVEGGYGRLVEFVRARAVACGAEIRLRSPVKCIRWSENGPVSLQLETGASSLSARLCVISAPLAVLQMGSHAGGLTFEPEVVPWRAQLKRLGMGHACRIVFEFDGALLATGVPSAAFIHHPTALFETFWAQQSEGRTLWTAWAGGPKAQELAKESAEQRERLALGSLATLFDLPEATLALRLRVARQHDFSNDPRARGAYSFCRPDGATASKALNAPLGNALFLAGEATDHAYPGTVAGAIASGQRAAKQALAVLGTHQA